MQLGSNRMRDSGRGTRLEHSLPAPRAPSPTRERGTEHYDALSQGSLRFGQPVVVAA